MGNKREAKENLQGGKRILALVGMPGAGKTEIAVHLQEKGILFVRFGELTEQEVQRLRLPLSPESEKVAREKIRGERGMDAYAVWGKPKIEKLLEQQDVVVVDGLYSWEEYIYLKKNLPGLSLIHVFAEPPIRYERLSTRPIRPVPLEECYGRDVAEIEKLNKGGPIAIADYFIENNGTLDELKQKVDALLQLLGIAGDD